VADDPLPAHVAELGVEPRDLGIPRQRDVVRGPATDRQPAGLELEYDLLAPAVAIEQERRQIGLVAHLPTITPSREARGSHKGGGRTHPGDARSPPARRRPARRVAGR